MNFNKHSDLIGKHAYLSASKYHWVNYDEEKIAASYRNFLAAERGTELHQYAALAIKLRQKQPRSNKTLNIYINDAIGYKMEPEQILYYSKNAFGTADTIQFRDGLLRIHDLKTGVTPAHMEQLEIYAALFCLEYDHKPGDIEIELRIYQTDDIIIFNPPAEDIGEIMNKIVVFDKIISQIRMEEDL